MTSAKIFEIFEIFVPTAYLTQSRLSSFASGFFLFLFFRSSPRRHIQTIDVEKNNILIAANWSYDLSIVNIRFNTHVLLQPIGRSHGIFLLLPYKYILFHFGFLRLFFIA